MNFVWKKGLGKRDEEKDRPNEVIFNITRSYEKDGKPVVDTNFNKEVNFDQKKMHKHRTYGKRFLRELNIQHIMLARMERNIITHIMSAR